MAGNRRIGRGGDVDYWYPVSERLERFKESLRSGHGCVTDLSEPDYPARCNPASVAEGANSMLHRWDTPPTEIKLHYVPKNR